MTSDIAIDLTSIANATRSIKRERAKMLRYNGPTAYMVIHRNVILEHSDDRHCICDPVIITQNDFRTSEILAEAILNPPVH